MSVLRRKLFRDVYGSKGLLLLIAAIIGVGVTVFVAMRSAYHNLSYAKQDYYRQCRMADFWVDVRKVPLAELDSLQSIPGITEIQPRIQFLTTVDLEQVPEPVNGLVVSLPDRPQSVLNGIVLQQGDYFTDLRRNEVIVNDKFARTHRLYAGDRIHLILNNRREELFIVGTAISSEFTYLLGPGTFIPDSKHFGVFYLKRTFAEEVFDFEGAANNIVGRLHPDATKRVDEILRRIEIQLEPYGVASTTALEFQSSNQFLSNEIAGLGTMAVLLSTIFLAVAATVLNILVSRMARRQRVVVGTLKALGYHDSQIFWHFLWFGVFVGVAGSLVGSVLGYLSATGMTEVYSWFFQFPELHSGFYWYTHAIGLAVSLVFSMAGSLRGARQMLRLRPAEAMRPAPPKSGRKIWLETALGPLWSSFSSSWKAVLRGMFRHRLRTATGTFAAMMAAGLLVNGFMMSEGQNFLIRFQFFRVSRSDIDLTFEDEQGEDAIDELRQLPGVRRVEPIYSLACTFVNGPYQRKGGITGLMRDAKLTVPHDVNFKPIEIPESGLMLTKRLAEILNVKVGDRVRIVPTRGERRPVEMFVARIADSYMGLAAYGELDFLSKAVGESRVLTGAQLGVDGSPSEVATLYRRLKEMPALESVQSRRDLVENITRTLLQNQVVFIGVLVAFSGVMFFGSMVNSSMVNLAERQSEVATLAALGYSDWEIGSMFFRENLLINLTGAILGLPFGYFLTWTLAAAYENDLLRLPIVTAPWIWWTTIVLALAFGCSAHVVVQWSIRRMDVVQALKVQE